VLSVRLIATLVVTFALLIVYEAYVRPKERLECEIITTLWVPALVIGLNLAAGLLPPHVVMPLDQLVPRAIVKLGVPIALARILFARDYDPNHPFRDLLDLHYRVWFYNFLWMALGVTYVMTLDQVVEAKSLQSFLVTALPLKLFITSIRYQLNPIGSKYRHSMIVLGLFSDPEEDEIRMKREYLLTGSDWFGKFEPQSVLEILAFSVALVPLVIDLWQWHIGDPNADKINWNQFAANAFAWLVLITTWPRIKKLNRETAKPFDERLRSLRRQRWAA